MSLKRFILPLALGVLACAALVWFVGSLRPLAPGEGPHDASRGTEIPFAAPAANPLAPDPTAGPIDVGTGSAESYSGAPAAVPAKTGAPPAASPTPTITPTLDPTSQARTQTAVFAQATYEAMATRANATPAPVTHTPPAPRMIDRTTNVLLIGTDERPDDPEWQANADVLMVLFADTVNHRVALLSFPRDLVVAIPRHAPARINQVYYDGAFKKGTAGGVDLLKRVLKDEYGIRVDHWATVDLDGLRRIIDTLGGIRVDVACPLEDTIDQQHFVIPAGAVDMDSLTARRYVQSRYSTSDTSRNYRQQRVLWAIAKKSLELNAPERLPALYDQLHNAVQTDMSLFDMLGLVPAVYQLDLGAHPERFHAQVLQPPAIYQWTSSQGAWLYMPVYEEIQKTLDHLFDAPVIAPIEAAPGECPPRPILEDSDAATATPAPTPTLLP